MRRVKKNSKVICYIACRNEKEGQIYIFEKQEPHLRQDPLDSFTRVVEAEVLVATSGQRGRNRQTSKSVLKAP